MFNCAGTRPTNLGVKEGKLLTCPDKKNCVLSQADIKDPHYIDPFKYSKDLKTSFNELKSVVESEKRTKVVTVTENYLYVEFKSLLMGYVDDVEFYFDDNAKIVHVRSASRLGSSDFGVNRKRIEHIRSKLNW